MNSPKKTARVAGFLYLIIFCLALFAELFVRQSLIVPGDAAETANNIMASEGLFRSGIVIFLIEQTVFLLLPLVLYKLLNSVNKNHAILMVIFVLVGIPIACINELNQFAVLLLMSGADYLTAFEADQLHTQVMLFLDLYEHGIFIAKIFWGLWLFPLGYLVFKSGFLPRILGVLLIMACFGYLIDDFIVFLLPNSNAILSLFAFIGEWLFALWLLIKGVNVEKWERIYERASR